MPERMLRLLNEADQDLVARLLETAQNYHDRMTTKRLLVTSTIVAIIASSLLMLGVIFVLNTQLSNAIYHNCNSISQLAQFQSQRDSAQNAQTDLLLKHHVTFGIPAKQLPGILIAEKRIQTKHQNQLDRLVKDNCD